MHFGRSFLMWNKSKMFFDGSPLNHSIPQLKIQIQSQLSCIISMIQFPHLSMIYLLFWQGKLFHFFFLYVNRSGFGSLVDGDFAFSAIFGIEQILGFHSWLNWNHGFWRKNRKFEKSLAYPCELQNEVAYVSEVKIWSKKDKRLIFFSSERWDVPLSKSETWVPPGCPWEALFWFEVLVCFWKFWYKSENSNQNSASQGTPFTPTGLIEENCNYC